MGGRRIRLIAVGGFYTLKGKGARGCGRGPAQEEKLTR